MKKRPLIIDTDPGIDDALAIAIALFAETVDVKLISTVAGNVSIDKVTYNAQRLLKFFNKEHIPIAKGSSRAIIEQRSDAASVHGVSGMEGWDFEEPTTPILEDHAVIAMHKVIMQSEEPITLMPIGPLTNIALLLRLFPEVIPRIKEIVFMGGSMNRGNHSVMSEFNIDLDPEAAYVVFHSGIPLVMAGLDIGMKALILPEDSEEIKGQNKTGQMAYALFKKYRSGSFNTGLKMYDATAIAYILAPELYTTEKVFVDVELSGRLTRGCTTVDLKGYLKKEPNMTVITDVDATKFRRWFIQALSKCN